VKRPDICLRNFVLRLLVQILVRKSRIKQSTLDAFFKKFDKRPPTDEPPTGQSPKMNRSDDSSPSTSSCFFYDFFRGSMFIV
jgi:hypothetical protein